MKKNSWLPVFWALFVATFIVSAFSVYTKPPFEGKESRIWQIEYVTGKDAASLVGYSLTIDPAGYLVLVCPEAISAASWTWKNGELTFHIRAEDPVLKSLGRAWHILENSDKRLRLQDANGSIEVHLVSGQQEE